MGLLNKLKVVFNEADKADKADKTENTPTHCLPKNRPTVVNDQYTKIINTMRDMMVDWLTGTLAIETRQFRYGHDYYGISATDDTMTFHTPFNREYYLSLVYEKQIDIPGIEVKPLFYIRETDTLNKARMVTIDEMKADYDLLATLVAGLRGADYVISL